MKLNRRSLFILSLVTLFGFGTLGLLLIYWLRDMSPLQFFTEHGGIILQIVYGLLFGGIAVFSAILLVRSPWMRKTRGFFSELITEINPQLYHILFYSFCAGVGEEILFRGAIQPFLGIWITSILFIFMHGYLSPYNWQISIYGIFMVMISAGFGYLYSIHGIFAAITAHFLFDVVMFKYLVKMSRRQVARKGVHIPDEEDKSD